MRTKFASSSVASKHPKMGRFRHFFIGAKNRRHQSETKNVAPPRALTRDGVYEEEEEEEEEDDESFYVGDVECIADVSFVSDADGTPGDVKLMAKKSRIDEGKL